MRIELRENFSHKEVAEWMNKHIGPIEEDVTWFWSTGEVYKQESPYYPGLIEEKVRPEGIRIWKNDPKLLTMAALKWR